MSAQAKTAPTAPTASFSALERADWRGVMDLDPQCEPLVPEKAEEKDWYDLAIEAERSCRNATRCDSVFMRRANLLVAKVQISQALEKLR